jgi:hypothetical protein
MFHGIPFISYSHMEFLELHQGTVDHGRYVTRSGWCLCTVKDPVVPRTGMRELLLV